MAITKTDFLIDLASDLEEYGDFSVQDGGKLDRSLLYAMRDFWEKRDWSFKFSSGNLTVSEGNQGPYDPPVGFDSLVTPEAVSRYFDYDRFAVPAPIPDDANGYKYDIVHDRLNNTLTFRTAPAAGVYTLYYRRALLATSDLSNWPPSARRFLKFQTMHYALVDSEDLSAQADRFFQRANAAYTSILQDIRRGESKQESREPRDIYGYPIAKSYSNDGDGFLGGG